MNHSDSPVAVVTGGAGGLGSVIATVLQEDGFRVALVDLDAAGLEMTAGSLPRPGDVSTHPCDITSPDQVVRTIADIIQRHGRIDALVNNAGIEPAYSFDDPDPDVWDRTMDVNVRAPTLLVQACVPTWREQGHGTVVCVGSRTWLSGSSTPAYVTSKAALVGLVRSITAHLGPIGVTANVVAPSFVRTPLNQQKWEAAYVDHYAEAFREASPLRRLVEPRDVAYAVSFLASTRGRNISGEVIHVAAGSQLAPHVI